MSGKLNREQIEKIPELYQTKTRKEIAELLKISEANVGYWITRLRKKGYKIPLKTRSLI